MRSQMMKKSASLLGLSLALALAGCGGMPKNASLNSTKQAVVERAIYTFDVSVGDDGLPAAEQQRLVGWFDALNVRYGDKVAIEDPVANAGVRAEIAGLASRYGLLVNTDAPVTPGEVYPGKVRVVVSRSSASVPGCPDWSARSDSNYGNALYPNYGCAINSNMAAMVADPEDLIRGQKGTGETVVMSSTKAIQNYRKTDPTGAKGLNASTTTGGK